ncbi:hypothetical protein JRO89_XS02G0014300 [Xanthoceras sorbifolium]|uniref:DRBM domain-containing protein n=1 Tax=Xanthoceras sorbifolium TaxID=99658 RepID=A0ABQ8IDX9_9ROSI|nr:hypothetical protein JRO89_XS02G0014300 [Xanthoceras sorbifolium]
MKDYTVMVDGKTYTSSNTFSHRKAAEQDVAKLALKCISKKIKNEECPPIVEVCCSVITDTIFCKSILNEFTVNMSLKRPTYNTIQPEGRHDVDDEKWENKRRRNDTVDDKSDAGRYDQIDEKRSRTVEVAGMILMMKIQIPVMGGKAIQLTAGRQKAIEKKCK